MRIIVGLGNPGDEYGNTRHNIGWLALDNLLGEVKWSTNKKFNALTYEDGGFLFVKPLTFMNNSGQAVQKILNYYKLLPKSFGVLKKKDVDLNNLLTVVHDDLDLNFGDYKIATDSGSAGHRGVESIINYLKTKKITRLRLGIKNDLLKTHIPPDKFVLQPFSNEEKNRLKEIFAQVNIKNLN
ncbi:MAG: aminoacyl-tRNA hydrolase [Patescibacteria group bacterium]|jgi:PTH1 family peptidyl-tRNA hydrolase